VRLVVVAWARPTPTLWECAGMICDRLSPLGNRLLGGDEDGHGGLFWRDRWLPALVPDLRPAPTVPTLRRHGGRCRESVRCAALLGRVSATVSPLFHVRLIVT